MRIKSCFLTARTFAVWVGLIAFAKIFGGAYTKSVLTTIERRFQLSSAAAAVIATGAQIGNLTIMLFIGYLGQRFNRPRLIGIGCLFMTAGYLLAGLPQFIGGRYNYEDISVNSSKGDFDFKVTCSNSTSTATASELCDSESESVDSSNLYILTVLGIILTGFGDAPLFPLGFSYVDDHASQHNAAVYIGIVHTIALVGPIAGFVAGAAFLKVWVDVGWVDLASVTINPRDPAWVGAWWLGFYIAAGVMICVCIPVWFYPKKIKKEGEKKEKIVSTEPNQNEELNYKDSYNQTIVPEGEWRGFFPSLKKLFRNQKYVLTICMWICESFKVSGVVTFMVKYLEVGFGKSAAQASFLVGSFNFAFLVVGTMLGAMSIKRWKMEFRDMLRLIFVAYVLTILTYIALMLVGCGPNDFAGITAPYPTSKSDNLTGALGKCNSQCNCDSNAFTPVCGPNQMTYQSPCFAGCTDVAYDESGHIKNYTSCSCAAVSPHEQSVSVGRCYGSKCEDITWLVIAITSFSNFLAGLGATPKMMMLLRTMAPQEKSFGLGIGFFLYRVLGWIPAPIVFGYAIDNTCLLWTQKQCSSRSYCRLYDTNRFRLSFGGMLLLIKVLSSCFLVALYVRVCRDLKKQKYIEMLEKKKLSPESKSLNESENDSAKEEEEME